MASRVSFLSRSPTKRLSRQETAQLKKDHSAKTVGLEARIKQLETEAERLRNLLESERISSRLQLEKEVRVRAAAEERAAECYDKLRRFELGFFEEAVKGHSPLPTGLVRTDVEGDGPARNSLWTADGILDALERCCSSCVKPLHRVIIFGAPASGKGTQCAMIVARYGCVHISTGDALRAAVAAGTSVGQRAKSFMDAGQLVPDEVIIGIVKERLAQKDCRQRGWLLDGFPRTGAQARALAESGLEVERVLELDVPPEVLEARVVGRRTDPVTGEIYHTSSLPASEEVRARLVVRSDDTAEKCKVRITEFQKHVAAVKEQYASVTTRIDGTQPKAKVFEAIKAVIDGDGRVQRRGKALLERHETRHRLRDESSHLLDA